MLPIRSASVPGSEFEYVVIGLGGLGSGAAYRLARRAGPAVLAIEQFELGHDRGASQDHSRIIRRSYHTPGYVRLADQAYRAWEELEAEAGERLIVKTGGLDLWPEDAAIPMADYVESMTAVGVPFERLDAGQVMRRWPQWRLADDVRGVFQEDAGIAPAIRCNEAHRRLAREHGATLRDRTPVTAIEIRGSEALVRTADGSAFPSRRVILAADAWTNRLTEPLGTTLPLTVTQEQVTYFGAPDLEAFAPDRFPIWIWMDDPSFYGFPVYGHPGVKVAQDCGGPAATPETRTFEPDPDNLERVRSFTQRCLPGVLGPMLTKTCLYTLPPDRDFIIDALPDHPEVLIALGAAHAFKFSSLIGRALADLAVEGRTDLDLEPFRIDRPALTEENAPVHWLI
jgi:sarcosine oxidase